MLPRTSIVVVAFVCLTVAVSQAATIAGGPLPFQLNDDYVCSVANIGTKDLSSVVVRVTIVGSNVGSGTTTTCEPLAPNGACSGVNSAGSANGRFCTVTVAGGKSKVRGAFCNTTNDTCVPLQ